jgi:hypothetical protein
MVSFQWMFGVVVASSSNAMPYQLSEAQIAISFPGRVIKQYEMCELSYEYASPSEMTDLT